MEEDRKPTYWIARLSIDEYWDKTIDERTFIAQYRYDANKDREIVTKFLNNAMQVKYGDILLLARSNENKKGSSRVYAYGKVVECLYKGKPYQISSLGEVIRKKEHDYCSGIVHFEETDIFYEDLTGGPAGFGQRIKVDQWHCYVDESSIHTYGLQYDLKDCGDGAMTSETLLRVSPEYGAGKVAELEQQYEAKNKNK